MAVTDVEERKKTPPHPYFPSPKLFTLGHISWALYDIGAPTGSTGIHRCVSIVNREDFANCANIHARRVNYFQLQKQKAHIFQDPGLKYHFNFKIN